MPVVSFLIWFTAGMMAIPQKIAIFFALINFVGLWEKV